MNRKKIITGIVVFLLTIYLIPAVPSLAANYVTYNGTKIYYGGKTGSNISPSEKQSAPSTGGSREYIVKYNGTGYQSLAYNRPSGGSNGYVLPRIQYGDNKASQTPTTQPTTPPSEPAPTPSEPTNPTQPSNGYQISSQELEMIKLINQEREKAGVRPLIIDNNLAQVARLKSEDMRDKGYFSHTSPTYGSPFQMMKDFGISYRSAGENIAKASSVISAHNALMNSEGHRKNILNSSFTHIGVGIANGKYYTQMFISK